MLAEMMYHDWSTKLSTFSFTLSLSLTCEYQLIRRYRLLLRDDLEKILEEHTQKISFVGNQST
jgi:hypothetical protein